MQKDKPAEKTLRRGNPPVAEPRGCRSANAEFLRRNDVGEVKSEAAMNCRQRKQAKGPQGPEVRTRSKKAHSQIAPRRQLSAWAHAQKAALPVCTPDAAENARLWTEATPTSLRSSPSETKELRGGIPRRGFGFCGSLRRFLRSGL